MSSWNFRRALANAPATAVVARVAAACVIAALAVTSVTATVATSVTTSVATSVTASVAITGARVAAVDPGAQRPAAKKKSAPAAAADIPLRLTVYAMRYAVGGGVRISTAIELPPASGAEKPEKLVAASATLFDATGAIAGQWTATEKMLAAPTLTAEFVQNPGTFRVRVTARTASKKTASATASIDAALSPGTGGLSMSAMVFGVLEPIKHVFVPHAWLDRETESAVMFELYGGHPQMAVSIVMEIAKSIDAPATLALHPAITATPEPDKFVITAPIALATLSPGNYIVRAIVGIDGLPTTQINGSFRR